MLYGELRTGLYSHATRIIYSKQLDLGQSFPWVVSSSSEFLMVNGYREFR